MSLQELKEQAYKLSVGDRIALISGFENDAIVKIVAIGYKEHNDLFIWGERVNL